jgi:hypothetical protein
MKFVDYSTLCRDWISRLIGRHTLMARGYARAYKIILMMEPSLFVDLRSSTSKALDSTSTAERPMQ